MARARRTIHSHQVRPSWGQRVPSAWSRGAEGRVATSDAVTGARASPVAWQRASTVTVHGVMAGVGCRVGFVARSVE